ncbi:DUF2095 family protein [[Eubacterium] cellulosolvens]
MVEINKDELRKKYPNLWNEINNQNSTLENAKIENIPIDKFRGYTPNATDYLRRCEKNEEAERTISYLLKKGEISLEYAKKLRKQLKEKGLRSFGPKKEDGYYLREVGIE